MKARDPYDWGTGPYNQYTGGLTECPVPPRSTLACPFDTVVRMPVEPFLRPRLLHECWMEAYYGGSPPSDYALVPRPLMLHASEAQVSGAGSTQSTALVVSLEVDGSSQPTTTDVSLMEANVEATAAEYLVASVLGAEQGFDSFNEAAEHDVDLNFVARAYGEASTEVSPQPRPSVAQSLYLLTRDWQTLGAEQPSQASAAGEFVDEVAANMAEGATSERAGRAVGCYGWEPAHDGRDVV